MVALQAGSTLDYVKLDGVQLQLDHSNKQNNPYFHGNESPFIHLIENHFIEYGIMVGMLNKEFNGTKA